MVFRLSLVRPSVWHDQSNEVESFWALKIGSKHLDSFRHIVRWFDWFVTQAIDLRTSVSGIEFIYLTPRILLRISYGNDCNLKLVEMASICLSTVQHSWEDKNIVNCQFCLCAKVSVIVTSLPATIFFWSMLIIVTLINCHYILWWVRIHNSLNQILH